MNSVGVAITLYKGTSLGLFEPCEGTFLITSVTHSASSQPASQLFYLSAIDPQHRRQLMPLLNEFGDVFSRGPEDLGRANLVYHEITINAGPVRQPLKRTPMTCAVYLDDVIVWSPIFEEHVSSN